MIMKYVDLMMLLLPARATFNHPVDPCKLLCHMEYTVDLCKLVFADGTTCRNAFWADENQDSIIVDIVFEDDALPVSVEDAISILRAPKGGCEKLCKFHDSCIETGSNCKENDTCLNLFWNRGRPFTGNMTTCHSLDAGVECPDVSPVLCGKFADVQSFTADPTGVVHTEISGHADTKNSTNDDSSSRESQALFMDATRAILVTAGILSTLF